MSTRVFLLEGTKHDLADCCRYGDITYLFDQERNRRPSLWEPRLRDELIVQRLKQMRYDPKKDFFAMAGATALIVMATAALVSEYGEINALFFDAVQRSFVHCTLGKPHVPAS